MSRSSRLSVENSETIAPSGARNQCSGAGEHGVLVAGVQHHFVAGRVVLLVGGLAVGVRRRLAFHVDIDGAAPAAEGLLFAWAAVVGRVPVLGAGLPGEQDDLFGAHPRSVHVDNDFQPGLGQFPEPEVGHFQATGLFGGDRDTRVVQHGRGTPLGILQLLAAEHKTPYRTRLSVALSKRSPPDPMIGSW